jgi:hypothetical protein
MLGRSLSCRVGSAVALALFANESGWAAPVPVVDTTSNSPVSNVSREQLENLPVGRRIEDLIRTCPSTTIPTVSRQPDVLIDGKPLVDLNCVQPADIEMIEVFKTHNSVRAQYGAPPLAWDPLLVQGPQGAQGYVNVLTRTGQLVHASREGRGTVRENISQGLPSWDSMRLMGSWLSEKQYFQPGTFPNVSITGDWYQVGHYSQMIWPTTTVIGCARGVGMGSSWLVCRYDPGGNKDGKVVGIPPMQTQQVASAPGTFVRPRLIGGDYTGGGAQGAGGTRASLFDLGTYGGGAWTSDWFKIADDPSGIGVSDGYDIREAFAEIRIPLVRDAPVYYATTVDNVLALDHDYGFDGALFVGYDLGAFRLEAEVAYKRADFESFDTNISLPRNTPQQPVSNDNVLTGRRASLFDLGIYAGGAWNSDWFNLEPEPEQQWTGLLNDILNAPNANTGDAGYIFLNSDSNFAPGIIFIPHTPPDYAVDLPGLVRTSTSDTTPPPESILDDVGDGATTPPPESILDDVGQGDTKVEQPKLPTAEVYNQQTHQARNEEDGDEEPDVIAEVGEFDFYDYEKALEKCDRAAMQKSLASLTAKVEAARQLVKNVQKAAAMGAPTDPTLEDANNQLKEAEHWLERAQRLEAHCPQTDLADTKVEPPSLPNKEVFKPEPPEKLEDPL